MRPDPSDASSRKTPPITLAQARAALSGYLKSDALEKELAGPTDKWRGLVRNEIESLRSERVLGALKTAEVSDRDGDWGLLDIWWIDLSKARFSATLSHHPYYEFQIDGHFHYAADTGWVAAVDSFRHADTKP
jgi:hypothetical protein